MTVVPMQKVNILCYRDQKEAILAALKSLAVIDLSFSKSQAAESLEIESRMGDIKASLDFLLGFSHLKRGFIEGFLPPQERVSAKTYEQAVFGFDHAEIVKKCDEIEGELANLSNLESQLTADLTNLLPWQNLPISLDDLNCGKYTCKLAGRIKTGALKDNEWPETCMETIYSDRTNTFIVLVAPKNEKEKFLGFLSGFDFDPVSLPLSPRTPKKEIEHLQGLLKKAQQEKSAFIKEAQTLLEHVTSLKCVYDHLLNQKIDQEIERKLAGTKFTAIIEGWIKRSDFVGLREKLSRVTTDFEIAAAQPKEEEKPPIVLANAKGLSPFELITQTFSPPKSGDIDPTAALSFFFVLFFGICLGDVGYGIMLALTSIYFLKRYRLPKGGQNIFKLLFYGGLSSVAAGVLTGSYFGVSPAEMPFPWLKSLQIIDPVKDPITMLLFSLFLGVVQILFGIFLSMAWKIKNGDYFSAIVDDAAWMIFLSSLVVFFVSSAVGSPAAAIASKVSIIMAIWMVLTQGRHKKNIFQKFTSGLLSLYRLSGYLGDTLSYSRLLALGMSTSIIGAVINILSRMVFSGLPPAIGFIIVIPLLLLGHAFNLIISTLGAFIHSTRLQMVEFFSKFYEGGGKEFRPYQISSEYVSIES